MMFRGKIVKEEVVRCNPVHYMICQRHVGLSFDAIKIGVDKVLISGWSFIQFKQANMTTRFQSFLDDTNDDDLEDLVNAVKQYASSTLRKHEWSLAIYNAFATRRNKEADVIDLKVVAEMVPLLMRNGMYEANAVQYVIIASLKRIYRQQQNIDKLSVDEKAMLTKAFQDGKKASNNPRFGKGKSPMINSDVEYIINTIPLGDKDRAHDASLITFGLHTGARAISCSNMELRDLTAYQHIDNTTSSAQLGRLFIVLRITKGNPSWNHPITLEGYPTTPSNIDVVYWLRAHIMKKFKLDMIDIGKGKWLTLSDDEKKQRIWDTERDAMRERVKRRAYLAGYNKKMFGFHSLRSGFMGSAAIECYGDEDKMKGALETTAFIAGWDKNSKVQQRYIKDAVKGAMVASRLVAGNQLGLSTQVVDKSIAKDPATFHRITLVPSAYPINTNMEAFHERMKELLYNDKFDEVENKRRYNSLMHVGFRIYCEEHQGLMKKVREIKKEGTTKNIIHLEVQLARQHITKKLHENFSLLDELVKEVHGYLKDNGDLERDIGTYQRKKLSIAHEILEKREVSGKSRKRIKWTKEEDEILLEVKSRNGNWREAAEKLLSKQYYRTPKDCYDRYRNMEKRR